MVWARNHKLIGSTDTHVLGGSFDESNYWSKVGILDGTPESRGTIPLTQERIDTVRQGLIDTNQPVLLIDREQGTYMDVGFDQWGAGLAAVWAEENTRNLFLMLLGIKKLTLPLDLESN